MSSMDQQITAADEAFVREAGQSLRDGADALDAHTRSRLNQARQRALDELRSKNRAQRWFADQWAPAVAVALLAVLTIAIWFNSRTLVHADIANTKGTRCNLRRYLLSIDTVEIF